ncbi:MAG: DUF2927 domain-containing protein [Pseudomonadota bacterium]
MFAQFLAGLSRRVASVEYFIPVCLVLTTTVLLGACSGSISRETYAGMADQLQDAGLLRTDRAPADAPYTAEEITRNFQRIAFSYEFQFRDGQVVNEPLEKPLNRWAGLIRYRIMGDGVTQADIEDVARLTQEVSALTGLRFDASDGAHDMLITIASTKGRADIAEFFRSRQMFKYRERYEMWQASPTWVCGATMSGAKDGSDQLVYAHIFMGAELQGILRQSCLHEEIVQALGLTNDHPDARPSIFNDDQEFALLTDHDATLLRVLYDPALRPGMTKAEAMPIVSRNVSRHMSAMAHMAYRNRLAARPATPKL